MCVCLCVCDTRARMNVWRSEDSFLGQFWLLPYWCGLALAVSAVCFSRPASLQVIFLSPPSLLTTGVLDLQTGMPLQLAFYMSPGGWAKVKIFRLAWQVFLSAESSYQPSVLLHGPLDGRPFHTDLFNQTDMYCLVCLLGFSLGFLWIKVCFVFF